jgi:subtilase family serine protease
VTIPSSTVTIHTPAGAAMSSTSVGTSDTSTGLLTLPATGTYTILVVPASSGTGSLTLTVGAPDLVVLSVDPPTNGGMPGSDGKWRFPMFWTVKNAGSTAALAPPAWRDRLFISTSQSGTPSDVEIGYQDRATALAAGAAYTAGTTAEVPSTWAPGTYWIRVVTDTGGAVVEANETNNVGVSATQVTLSPAPPPPPDLTVSTITVPSATVAPQMADGTWRFQATWTVQNNSQGAAPASATWTDRLYISIGGTGNDVSIGQLDHSGGLAAGGNYTASMTVTVPATWSPGSFWIRVVSDADNSLPESNESNNAGTSSSQVTLGGRPDLWVTSVAGPQTAVAPQADGTWVFTVTGTVRNNGPGVIPYPTTWVDRVYLSTVQAGSASDPVVGTASVNAAPLAGGQTYSGSVTATAPATMTPGAYWIRVRTDAADQIFEGNESNNWGASAAQVTLGPRPDLVIISGTWPTTPVARSSPGGPWQFSISATIQNIGGNSAASAAWWDRAYISTTQAGCPSTTMIGQLQHSGGLAANATYVASGTVTVPGSFAPGQYWLCVKTDDGNELFEANEGNNVGVSTSQVTLSP